MRTAVKLAPSLVDLCDLRYDNSFVRELPGDPVLTNVPRAVRNACYTRVAPTPVDAQREDVRPTVVARDVERHGLFSHAR